MKPLRLLASILLCESAGIIGSVFTVSSVSTWYVTLNKPFFTPPSWVFGPVWTTLYALMGVALYVVWQTPGQKRKAYLAFASQLILNTVWSIAFFGLRSPAAGLLVIMPLWVTIVWTSLEFRKISPQTMYLLTPYLLWVTYAALLNAAVWQIN